MLGGDGEARGRVLPSVEAQQREGCSNAAMCHTLSLSYFVFCSEDEEKVEEEGKREEEVGGPTCLPPTPGGGERPASQQTDEATRCCF